MAPPAATKAQPVTTSEGLRKRADEVKDRAVVVLRGLPKKVEETKEKAVMVVRDPQFQMCTLTTAGGAITFGAVGGAFGLASGVVVGSAAGVVPALFTFGLSIPVGGMLGGIGGLCTGTLVGGSSGGVCGFTLYKYRVEIKDGMVVVKVRVQDAAKTTKLKAVKMLNNIDLQVQKARASVVSIANQGKQRSVKALDYAKAQAGETITFATSTRVGVTSSSAVAGAVVGGTTTGAFGTVAGAAIGVVPAIFTFGLSIPVGAVIGLCVGTTVGGSAGAIGGGALGYGGFTHREAITNGVQSSWNKVSTKAEKVKLAAFTHAADAKQSMKSMVRASTGGSEK